MNSKYLLSLVLLACAAAKPPASQPANPKDRPYASGEAVYNAIPKELRPADGKWDEFTAPKANKWLADNLVGAVFDGPLTIRGVDVTRVPDPKDENLTSRWEVQVYAEPDEFKVGKSIHRSHVGVDSPSGFRFAGDEAFAKAAKTWKEGDKMRVSGTIVRSRVATDLDFDRKGKRVNVDSVTIWLAGGVKLVSVGKYKHPG